MTQTARMYGGSLYELAVEEQLVEAIGGEIEEIRQIFHENADYVSEIFSENMEAAVKNSGGVITRIMESLRQW